MAWVLRPPCPPIPTVCRGNPFWSLYLRIFSRGRLRISREASQGLRSSVRCFVPSGGPDFSPRALSTSPAVVGALSPVGQAGGSSQGEREMRTRWLLGSETAVSLQPLS